MMLTVAQLDCQKLVIFISNGYGSLVIIADV